MVSTLVVTLGTLGEALIDATNSIIGKSDSVGFFCVGWEQDLENAKIALGKAIREIDQNEGVLLLTDMFGGTSTNISLSYYEPEKVEIITGVNLPMIVKALTLPEGISLAEAARILKAQGQKAIYVAGEKL